MFTPVTAQQAVAHATPRRTEVDAGFSNTGRQQSGGRPQSGSSFLFPGCAQALASPSTLGLGAAGAMDPWRRNHPVGSHPQGLQPASIASLPKSFASPAHAGAPISLEPAPATPKDEPPLASILDRAITPGVPKPRPTATSHTPMPFASASGTPAAHQPADGYWVTAFGYNNQEMLPAVLEELRPPGGDIRRHEPGLGLWVHVCFNEKHEQQQALAKNGRVIHGTMLGVIDGIVPAGSAGSISSRLHSTPASALSLQHTRGETYTVRSKLRAPAAKEVGVSAMWTAVCEYAFGW